MKTLKNDTEDAVNQRYFKGGFGKTHSEVAWTRWRRYVNSLRRG